jgi:GTP-binding protein LepA
MAAEKTFEVLDVGIFKPAWVAQPLLKAGDVGYIVANIKDVADARVGDTVTDAGNPTTHPLPGYRPMKPMVFSGIYPVATEDYENLKDALGKLVLNDSSLSYEPETSVALGFGFRCGFLGPLHSKSCRSGWSASTTWTSSPPCRTSATRSWTRRGTSSSSRARWPCPSPT